MSKKKHVSEAPPPQKELYLSYKETHTGGESESDEQWSSRSPSYTEVTFTGLSRVKDDSGFFPSHRALYVDDDVYAAEEVYLVVYRYQDGDTFGTSHGNWGVYAVVKSEEEALKIGVDIESGTLHKDGKYLPWEGYFSSLEGIEIHSFRVGNTPRSGNVSIHRH